MLFCGGVIMNSIYTITTMTKLEQTQLGLPNFGSTRTVAWYNTFDNAEETVVCNNGDIRETCYQYAVIEEMEEGLYPISKQRWFYKYNIESDEYEEINEPEWMNPYINISFG